MESHFVPGLQESAVEHGGSGGEETVSLLLVACGLLVLIVVGTPNS